MTSHSITNDYDIMIEIISLWFVSGMFEKGEQIKTFSECSLPSTLSKNTVKMIGQHARLRDMTGQSCPIYASARANHARYSSVQAIFCGSWKHNLLK